MGELATRKDIITDTLINLFSKAKNWKQLAKGVFTQYFAWPALTAIFQIVPLLDILKIFAHQGSTW